MKKDVLGFAQQQENGTHRLGYRLIDERNVIDAELNRKRGTLAENLMKDIIKYVPHFTPSTPQDGVRSQHSMRKTHFD